MLYNPRHVGEKIKLVKKNWKIKKKLQIFITLK